MSQRVPGIVRETARRNPDYPAEVASALEALAHALETDGPIPVVDDPLWAPLLANYRADTWLHTDWFFAETYLYRLVIEAVGWAASGRDPFAPHKQAELTGASARAAVWAAFDDPPAEAGALLADRLLRSLWGNRADLSLKEAAHLGLNGAAHDLLIDERAAAVEHLLAAPGGHLHLIADNAGAELLMDCLLIDVLLHGGDGDDGEPLAGLVTLHVKHHPTFVSDATASDTLTTIAELAGRGSLTHGFGPEAAAAGERLQAALLDGRLLIQPHPFWNSGHFLFEAPGFLAETFGEAALVIQKGDANYRRGLGDALWPADAAFAEVMAYFPAPLLALRTLKSDPIVGLAQGQAALLDAADAQWRVNGRRAVACWKG